MHTHTTVHAEETTIVEEEKTVNVKLWRREEEEEDEEEKEALSEYRLEGAKHLTPFLLSCGGCSLKGPRNLVEKRRG